MLCFFFLRNLQASVRTRRILLLNTKTVQESLLIVSFDKTAKPLCKVHSYVGVLVNFHLVDEKLGVSFSEIAFQ